MNLFQYYIISFTWCMMRYTIRWLCVPRKIMRSTKFLGRQRPSKSGLHKPENIVFPFLACDLSDKHVRWNSVAETTNLRVIEKINIRLNSFFRKNLFLNVFFFFHRLPCNVFVQPQFDYAYILWCSGATKNMYTCFVLFSSFPSLFNIGF